MGECDRLYKNVHLKMAKFAEVLGSFETQKEV